MIRIALTNLGKYNEGHLVFKWVDLPASEEALEEALEAIGIDGEEYEEYFITDYESDIEGIEIGEYDNLEELNDLAEELDNLKDWELEIVEAILETGSYGIKEALEKQQDGDYSYYEGVLNELELGEYVVNEGLFGVEIPDTLARYIDYEAIGRDWAFDGCFTSKGFIVIP